MKQSNALQNGVVFILFAFMFTSMVFSTTHPMMQKRVADVVGKDEVRYINGTNNNLENPQWGAVGDVMYPYGFWPEYDANFHLQTPNPRLVADNFFIQPSKGSRRSLSQFVVNFLAMIQADIGSTAKTSTQAFSFPAPPCDRTLDFLCKANETISFRSFVYTMVNKTEGNETRNIKMRLNPRTSYFDLESVYSYYQGNAIHRTYKKGQLETYDYYTKNQVISLFDVHWTDMMIREHNRLAQNIYDNNPNMTDEQVFQMARKWNIAYAQKIFSKDYAAAFLGVPLPPYSGYSPNLRGHVDIWGHLLLRYAHYELPPAVVLVDNEYKTDQIWYLNERYFSVNVSFSEMTKLIRGAIVTEAMEIGTGAYRIIRGGFLNIDAITLDIIRSRELGIPKYNDMRKLYGLPEATSFYNISEDPAIVRKLIKLYGDVSRLDSIVGAMLETHVQGASCGPLMRASLLAFYQRIRDSDRFWYEAPGMFTPEELTEIYGTTPLTIVTRNFPEMQELYEIGHLNLFFLPNRQINSTSTLFPLTLDSKDWRTIDMSSVYRLSWSTTTAESENSLEFVVQVKTKGWVGLGFKSDENTMKNADIIILRDLRTSNSLNDTSSAPFEALDCYALDVGTPAFDTSLPGGTNDVTPVSFQMINGVRVFRFKRKWATDDVWDKPLTKNEPNKVIFSYNTETLELMYHGPSRSATARINFNQGEVKLKKLPIAISIVVFVLSGVSITFAAIVFFCIWKNKTFFKHLSYRFCLMTCLGFILGFGSVILFAVDEPSDNTCLAFIWLLGLSFVFVFCSIFLKALRLWEIFRALKKSKFSKQPMTPFTDTKLFVLFFGFLLAEIILLIAWSVGDPLKAKTVLVENETEKNIRCKSDSHGWWIAFIVYKLIVMFVGSFFVIELRDKKDSLSESKRVIFCLTMTFFTTLVSCVVGFFLTDKSVLVEVSLLSFAVLFIYNMNSLLLFFPLMMRLVKHTDSSSMRHTEGQFTFNRPSGGSS